MFGSTKSRDPDANRPDDAGPKGAGGRGAADRSGKTLRDAGNTGRPHSNTSTNGSGRPRRLSGSSAVEYAKGHLMEMTGRPCEAVSSLNRGRDGWRVVLEVIELERIPRTTDILASYSVELDENGELMGYERINRYYRNDVNTD